MTRRRTREPRVVDTNVPIAANRANGIDRQCANSCTKALLKIKQAGKLIVDNEGEIFDEYRRHLSLSGQPGTGDAFIRWAYNNRGRKDLVVEVEITPSSDGSGSYNEFPSSNDLSEFDRSDRKFVAVALKHGQGSRILNATDSDWWHYRDALARFRVEIEFICPERFQSNRRGD